MGTTAPPALGALPGWGARAGRARMQKLSFPENASKCSRLTLWAIETWVVFIFFVLANLRLSDFLSHLCLGEGICQGLALAASGPVGSPLTQPGPASAPVPGRQGPSSRHSPHP